MSVLADLSNPRHPRSKRARGAPRTGFSPSKLISCIALLLATLSFPARGAIMHASTPSSSYETYGQGSAFQSVGWLKATEFGSAAASCVLIDSHWALTDAHCVQLTSTSAPNTNLSVGFGTNYLTSPGTSHVPTQYFIHPDFTSYGVSPDIALLYFADPISEVTPATLYTGTLAKGRTISTVGYGQAGTAGSPGAFDGLKRGHTDAINSLLTSSGSEEPNYVDSVFAPIGSPLYPNNSLGGAGSPGDSGGGMFVLSGSSYRLAGLIDYSTGSDYYASTGYLQTSVYSTWINTTMASVPEPGGLAVLFLNVALLTRRRRQA